MPCLDNALVLPLLPDFSDDFTRCNTIPKVVSACSICLHIRYRSHAMPRPRPVSNSSYDAKLDR